MSEPRLPQEAREDKARRGTCTKGTSVAAAATPLITVSPRHDALVVVDMQNDFVRPDGPLSVPGAAEVVPVINRLCRAYRFRAVVVTKDWHPPGHCSFRRPAGPGGPWPPHCVQATAGAALHPRLRLGNVDHVVHKGSDADAECYSGFSDEHGKATGLAALLREMDVRRVFICGVAFDYCVYYTALDALKENFEVVVLQDATRAVFPHNVAERSLNLQRAGVTLSSSKSLTASMATPLGGARTCVRPNL
ncbi:alpha/beta-hydrolase [Trypanosoma conorhini]|uniref:nicotinamidase n=1 Tax=Trypanosoma conorhini TaxID=83891 RepID=A0A422PZI3_9TRYP|nr:alpha/beta-hydrolase [Trypanosoma conorhini]RNF23134.1 alpha/beta-hydrolase [Trypanosoma conorhini]